MSLSDEARRIVENARQAYGPSEQDRARVAASLQLTATAAASSAAASGTAAAAAPATWLAGKTAVGLVVLAAVGGASAGYWWSRREPRPQAASAVQTTTPAAPARLAAPSVPALGPAAIERDPPPPARSSRSRSAPVARASAPKPATPELAPNVAGEIALLDEAQRALASGHPDQALQLLDRHAREFPRGTLIEERSAARIIALCALDRVTTARAESAAFVRRFPSSPLVERVRAACGGNLTPAAKRAQGNDGEM